ncbi:TPA: macro domain-containing protein [Vibrio diabolicus]
MNAISLVQGDITTAHVDAIVNAANPRMLGGGGVDGAIHRAAGPALINACYAVGPIYDKFADPKAVLESAYQRSLDLALANHCQSVALPAISCGVYGYPPQEAAEVAMAVCQRPEYAALDMRFYLFSEEMLSIWQRALTQH